MMLREPKKIWGDLEGLPSEVTFEWIPKMAVSLPDRLWEGRVPQAEDTAHTKAG